MPYAVQKLTDDHYRVINTDSRKIHSKHTTKKKADAQVRLLQALEHGMIPRSQK